jgi:two-component system response regulator FixJ
MLKGWQNKAIAFDLGISQRTVETHRARVMSKMKAQNLAALIRMTLSAGADPAH